MFSGLVGKSDGDTTVTAETEPVSMELLQKPPSMSKIQECTESSQVIFMMVCTHDLVVLLLLLLLLFLIIHRDFQC